LKSTGLAIGFGLWETIGMAKPRTPKQGNVVRAVGHNGVFAIIGIYKDTNTVDLQWLKETHIEKGVPWTSLIFTDEEDASQAAARIVREATED
jgi:hypothetical protein